ncbi:MAG: SCP2 sterol-binding domain-containing protein [Nitrospirae bacterium]|nr:SCP2 sterol-binding domain-containing protein [Nitrospirota bacterium]
MAENVIRPDLTPEKVKECLKAIDFHDRKAVREAIWDATPKQVFEIVIPTGHEQLNRGGAEPLEENTVVRFVVDGDGGGSWDMEVRKGKLVVSPSGNASPRTTITMSAETFAKLMRGQTSGMTAFMMRKLKVDGDLMLATKIQPLLLG